MCALVFAISAEFDISVRWLQRSWAHAARVVAAAAFMASAGTGCAKGKPILEEDIVRLDPTRPSRPDASAEAGIDPPEEITPPITTPDAAATPAPDATPPEDSGTPTPNPDASPDADADAAPTDGG